MSFPRNSLCVTFVDMPFSALETPMKLYLPLKRSVKYFKLFHNSSSVFVHTKLFPKHIRDKVVWFLMNSTPFFSTLSDENIHTFFPHETCLSFIKHVGNKRRFNKWMKLVSRVEKWKKKKGELKTAASELLKSKQILCSIFLYYAMSKKKLKNIYNV